MHLQIASLYTEAAVVGVVAIVFLVLMVVAGIKQSRALQERDQ